ncbi:MAG: hypothetical protein PWQ10_606 [Patescibacteria group bacterium]|nr:hypothetical protein [Patescibacteria group bacterium]
MITISVDYEGPKSIEEYYFTSFDKSYLDKLNDIEAYNGKIDRVVITRGVDSTRDFPGVFMQMGREELVNTTNVKVAIRKGKLLASNN